MDKPLPPIPFFDEVRFVSVAPISTQLRHNIDNLLREHHLPSLPDWWDYRWVVEKDDSERGYSGTFAKRLKKWLLVVHDLKPADTVISRLGERIHHCLPTHYEWYVDFTRDFGWQPGTYEEDDNSCWWTDRSEARLALAEGDGFAMRAYYPPGPGGQPRPAGRCWVATTPKGYVTFNGYGRGYGYTNFAAVLSGILQLDYQPSISVRNMKRSSGLLYANGSSGALVGWPEVIKDVSSIDLEIDVSEYCPVCNYCGKDLWNLRDYTVVSMPDGVYYRCDECRARQAVRALLPHVQHLPSPV